MPIYFLDSSALVKAYRQEAGSAKIIELVESQEIVVVSRLAQVEVSAAIVRQGQFNKLPKTELDVVLTSLDYHFDLSFHVAELSDNVMTDAIKLVRRYGLRGADAVQLACARSARHIKALDEVVFVSSDHELNASAFLEGFTVIDPSQ